MYKKVSMKQFWKGVDDANQDIYREAMSLDMADKKHEKYDAEMYKSMVCGKPFGEAQGRATAYGFYCHTGSTLKR